MSKIKKFIKRNKMFSLLAVAAIAIILVGIFAPVIATRIGSVGIEFGKKIPLL